MRTKLCVLAVCAAVTAIAGAANDLPLETLPLKVWEVDFGGSGVDTLAAVLRTQDGGYLLAGNSCSALGGNKTIALCGTCDFWIIKLDVDGRRQWERAFGGDTVNLAAASQTADGGYLLGGSFASPPLDVVGDCGITATNHGQFDFWTVRLDSNGHRLWEASFGGSDEDRLTALWPTSDGGFVLGGWSSSSESGNKSSPAFGGQDYWLVRIDTNGNKLWDRSFGGSGDDYLSGLAPTANGGFVVAGTSHSDVDGNKTSPSYGFDDFWVIRVDANGQKVWEVSSGGEDDDEAAAVVATADGGFAVAGGSYSESSGSKTAPNLVGEDFWVVRLDADGNQLWDEAFDLAGESHGAEALVAAPEGGLVFGGNVGLAEAGDFWTVRLDAAGKLVWDRIDGGTGVDNLASLDRSWGGGFVAGGWSDSRMDGNKTTPNQGDLDYWAINLFERTAPVGTPAVLVNGLYSPSGMLTYTGAATVTITSTFPNAHIFYTLDGSDPAKGAFYDGPFVVVRPVNIRALAWRDDFAQAAEAEALQAMVLGAPLLLVQPLSQQVALGESAAFNVVADGAPPLHFQWRFNEAELPDETNAFLLRANVGAGDNANFAVVVTNQFGAVTSAPATLRVLLPPDIALQPVSTIMLTGAPVMFCVTASGTAPLLYQWRRNGANIPEATNECYEIPDVQLADGATYNVVVANRAGAVTSDPAVLSLMGLPPLPSGGAGLPGAVRGCLPFQFVTDLTEGSGPVLQPSPCFEASGTAKFLSWIPDCSGIARVKTAGSSFDTVLAVYQTGVTNPIDPSAFFASLVPVACDNDAGGFFTSDVQFNAQARTNYVLVVDGYAGATGQVVLSLMIERTADTLPAILMQPESGSAPSGGNFTFNVTASGSGLRYQWYFFDVALDGATAPNFTAMNVQTTNAGRYTVRVSNSARTVESTPASLEIGVEPGVYAFDKLPDLLAALAAGAGAGEPAGPSPAPVFGGVLPVTVGVIGSRTFNNTSNSVSRGEPNHCGVIGGNSTWFAVRPETDGVLVIDTFGSSFDTLLSVYTGPTNYTEEAYLFLRLVTCDDNGAPDGLSSAVCFPARRSTNYLVTVDAVRGNQGVVRVNYRLIPPPPVLPATNTIQFLRIGADVTLSATQLNLPVIGTPQWVFNGTNVLLGATNLTLSLCAVQLQHGGDYSLAVRNGTVTRTNLVARLAVGELRFELLQGGATLQLRVRGVASQRVLLEATEDLVAWQSVFTPSTAATVLDYTERDLLAAALRLYRMRPLP